MNKKYRITSFGERYESEALRKVVFHKLYKASKKSTNPWVFELDHPGKHKLIDGRIGDVFEQPVTIGKSYMSKLSNQVDHKMHACLSGPYALVTQEPHRGKSKHGGK
jgi:DNA-directed RNA polymerase subunit beta